MRPDLTTTSDDADLVRRVLARDEKAFREVMQKCDERLFRLARRILRNDSEAEEVVQEAYGRAYAHLGSFRGDSSLVTWLTRIAMNEAVGRLRARRLTVGQAVLQNHEREVIQLRSLAKSENPEKAVAQRQILQLAQRAIDKLPDAYQSVFITRVIEGMSVEDTAAILRLRPATVKTRLHRARRLICDHMSRQIGPVLMNDFPF